MNDGKTRKAFVFGCGYLGLPVARKLIATGWQVYTLTRSHRRAKMLRELGLDTFVGDWTDSRVAAGLPSVERVLFAVGYDRGTRRSRHEVYVEGLRNVLPTVAPDAAVVYISTTGVYHQTGGVWVDENSPTRPRREGGRAHLRAEQLLMRFRQQRHDPGRSVVLRLAGIYGPGRVPSLEPIRRGAAIAVDPQSYLNLIHVEDAARCVHAAWQHPQADGVYAIADGHPVLRRDYYGTLARLLGAPEPRFETAGPGGASRRAEGSKRVWNRAMRRDLLARCQFPSYREGLVDALAGR
jgi:nucleoside-diphosphate-sugar epimerase